LKENPITAATTALAEHAERGAGIDLLRQIV